MIKQQLQTIKFRNNIGKQRIRMKYMKNQRVIRF
jgi:hypothetical protein